MLFKEANSIEDLKAIHTNSMDLSFDYYHNPDRSARIAMNMLGEVQRIGPNLYGRDRGVALSIGHLWAGVEYMLTGRVVMLDFSKPQ